MSRSSCAGWLLLVALLLAPLPASALEKYGRPLPGIGEASEGEKPIWLRGYLLTSAFVENPTFAARPDNTGLVGLRHMVHLETDLYKEYLQFYTDQNFFSDRQDGWIRLSEWDATFAFTGSLDQWSWRLQYEQDRAIDRTALTQKYADAIINYNFARANQYDWWRRQFPQQNLTFYVGGGWLFHNENFFARPDNTGRAFFRYLAHADLDLYKNRVVLFADTNWFSDRSRSDKVTPTELDWIIGLALRWGQYELAVLHEEDLPLDRGGLIQKYTALQLRYQFEWQR